MVPQGEDGSVLSAGEEVPEEEQLSAREQRSAEPCDNVPVIDNLPPAAGGDGEQSKYEQEVRNLYKQLDDKVRRALIFKNSSFITEYIKVNKFTQIFKKIIYFAEN